MIRILHSTGHNPYPETIDKKRNGSWINVVEPTNEELEFLAKEFNLEQDLLVDATDIYETPRVERDGEAVYVFARYCYPEGRVIATDPLLIVSTKNHLITVLRTKSSILDRLTSGIEPVATTQKTKTFLQILGAINYSYERNMYQVNRHILSIRGKLSKADIKNESFIEFIDIEENLNEYLSALQPQAVMLRNLLNGRFLTLYEQDKDLIEDLTWSTTELIDLIKSRLKTIANTREAYSSIMANNLNKTFKNLTSIGIFMTIPTITAGLYGMNVSLPLADEPVAFWLILVFVGVVTGFTIWLFKRLKWL